MNGKFYKYTGRIVVFFLNEKFLTDKILSVICKRKMKYFASF